MCFLWRAWSAKFSFASVGIQAQGRTTILRLNYRNTLEILSVARAFAAELLSGDAADEDGVPVVVPESAGRRGPAPELISCDSPAAEAQVIAARIRDEVDQGRSPAEVAIIYRKESQVAGLERELQHQGLPFCTAIGGGKGKLFEDQRALKVVSMHSSKGLEFSSAYIPGIGQMPPAGEDEVNEARLLYVAMTRATGSLVMTHHGEPNGFVVKVQKSIAALG